jgi:hypothetical protein
LREPANLANRHSISRPSDLSLYFSQSTIETFWVPSTVDENVLRLDIVVNDTFLVGSIQAIGDFNPDLQPLLDLEMAP